MPQRGSEKRENIKENKGLERFGGTLGGTLLERPFFENLVNIMVFLNSVWQERYRYCKTNAFLILVRADAVKPIVFKYFMGPML